MSLLNEALSSELDKEVKPVVGNTTVKPTPKRVRTTSRKPKPYAELATLRVVSDAKKAAQRAARKNVKASKPDGKMSKATTKLAQRKASVAAAKEGKSERKVGVCSFCGKPLSRHSSVTNGMGDVCAQKKALLQGRSLEDHMAEMTVYDAPGKEYLKLKDAITKAREKGTSQYRFLQAIGGDRMLRPAINEHFQVVIYKGIRYVPSSSLRNLKALEKV